MKTPLWQIGWRCIRDICILDIMGPHGETIEPFNKTQHYHQEIKNCSLDMIWVGSLYTPAVAFLLREYKFHSSIEYLDDILPYYQAIALQYENLSDYTIVPLPMHWSRYLIRGFDHTSILASALARLTHLPLYQLLSRRYSRHQSRLTRSARILNTRDSFILKKDMSSRIPDKVILIDDVISTGATVEAAASYLKSIGVREVHGWFLASEKSS